MPVRVLHIVENLNRGAVENWLVRVFIDACRKYPHINWTFFCSLGEPGSLDEYVRQSGGSIIYSPYPIGNKIAFFKHLRSIMKSGSYDILHCHHDFISGMYLWASIGIPFRRRIVHVHNTDESVLTPNKLKQLLYREPLRQSCLHLTDKIIGISRNTLCQFLRSSNLKESYHSVLYYGIDTSAFHNSKYTPAQFRRMLDLAEDSKILLFLGRMVPLKNPCFVIEILDELAETDPKIATIFVGAGELETKVKEMAKERGLENRIRLLGWRDDTASIMQACDVLVFPRLEEPKEGLGLVIVESQAAGLPVIMSRGITEDAIVIPELFEILPLNSGPRMWATYIQKMLYSKVHPSREDSLRQVEFSHFSMDASTSNLMSLYNISEN